MKPVFQGRLSAGFAVLDGDLRDLQIVNGPNGPVLYAVTGQQGGLSAFVLSPGTLASPLSSRVFFAPGSIGVGEIQLVLEQTVDGPRLALGSGKAVTSYDLQATGGFDGQIRFGLPAGSGRADDLTSARLTDGRVVYHVLDAETGRLSTLFESASRTLALTDVLPLTFETQNGASMLGVDAGGSRYLVVAGSGWSGPGQVASYRIDPDTGGLEFRDGTGAVDGLGLNTPTAMAAATADGVAWVVLGDAASHSLSVLRLGADGSLMPTDYLLDTRETRFGQVQAVAMLETEGHIFVVAGGGDDGFSLFSLLPNGRLIHIATLAHQTGLGLEDVTALEMAQVGNELQIFASGEGAGGLSQFSLPLGILGQVIRDVAPDGRILVGTAGNDVILASNTPALTGARDRLEGGAGDDTLVAGGEGSDLVGGAGSDRFVLGVGKHSILDFEPGLDRLDLSGLPFLRSPRQLEFTVLSNGAELRFGDTEVRIATAAVTPLSFGTLWPGGVFSDADHFPVGNYAPGQPGQITGTDADDRIQGSWINEYLTGGAGADVFVLTQNMGADTITDFDPAEDRLDFSALDAVQQAALTSVQVGSTRVITLGDSSTLSILGLQTNSAPGGTVGISGWAGTWQYLQADISTIRDPDGLAGVFRYQWLRNGWEIAGATASRYLLTQADLGAQISLRAMYMDGLGSREMVVSAPTGPVIQVRYGSDFNDMMRGGSGGDFLASGKGDDVVYGGNGGDTILGGDGNDKLHGEAGLDQLAGEDGDDQLWGGPDNDWLWGDDGADLLVGGDGDDRLWGGAGNDTLWGETGNDTQWGGEGDDALGGGPGNDVLFGEEGADRLWGGDGNDNLWGGTGDDRIWGGRHNDALGGAEGNDTLSGGNGDDRLWGGSGNDRIWGEAGNDVLWGGDGDDALGGGPGRDVVLGEAGADWIWGGDGNDDLWGGSGNDRIWGGRNDDALGGGNGDDLLWAMMEMTDYGAVQAMTFLTVASVMIASKAVRVAMSS
ncbi:calcium-binding protein [Ruegeria sediminis]|nr:hypothetical protein [Ruegeria sediminis]